MAQLETDLQACPLFASLGPAELERVARNSRSVRAPAGTLVFRDGQPFDGFYVVAEGCVRIYKVAPDGREHTLHIVRPPRSFAEAALFADRGYPAFAEAIEDSRLVLVRRDPFLALLREEPGIGIRMLESLSQWVHRLVDQLEAEAFLSARARLAAYLLREARKSGASAGACRLTLSLPKKDIASQLGMAPETYSRAQGDLESRGLIRTSGRQVEIPDLGELEESILQGGNA
jgi:CRP/FNR family transcriptional regulator, dissimilatory nitrate respiration regulator